MSYNTTAAEASVSSICDRLMRAFVDAVIAAGPASPVGRVRDALGRPAAGSEGWGAVAIPILRARAKAMLWGDEYAAARAAVLDRVHLSDGALFAAVLADALKEFGAAEVA